MSQIDPHAPITRDKIEKALEYAQRRLLAGQPDTTDYTAARALAYFQEALGTLDYEREI